MEQYYKIAGICFLIGLIIGFSGGFGLGKKEVSFERGISLVMFTIWVVALVLYGSFDKEMPLFLNAVGAGSALTLMGINAGEWAKNYLSSRLGNKL